MYVQNAVQLHLCVTFVKTEKFSYDTFADTDVLILEQLKWSG